MENESSLPTILIVDDVPANIQFLAVQLKSRYQIKIATSGEKGLHIAESKNPPDLILLDIMMPEMDGYEVCKRLKGNPKTKNIPVFFVTAMGEVEDETKGLELGAVDYITKPVTPAIINARIKAHLELKKYRDHLEQLVDERTVDLADANIKLRKEIEERIRLEKQEKIILQDKFSNLEQLAVGLAHEVNQPLTYINTVIQVAIDSIKNDKINPEKMLVKFTKAAAQVARIIELTNHLRALRWPSEMQHEQVDLSAVINDSMNVMNEPLKQHAINLNSQIPDDLPPIYGNHHKLEQIFINLTTNAIAALQEQNEKEITVAVVHEKDQVTIRFSDNGCGMVPEVQDKMFEAFFTTKDRGQGAGIGMCIVLDIVSEHHGTISCDSIPGRGTAFSITLPLNRLEP
nr:response regulator [Desulfobulbaceae bacterium]